MAVEPEPTGADQTPGLQAYIDASQSVLSVAADSLVNPLRLRETFSDPQDGRQFVVDVSSFVKPESLRVLKISQVGVERPEIFLVPEPKDMGIINDASHTSYPEGRLQQTRGPQAAREAEVLLRRLLGLPAMEKIAEFASDWAWKDALSDETTRTSLDRGIQEAAEGRTTPWEYIKRKLKR